MTEWSDHYATLGLQDNASSDDIRAAYKRLALKHHPDKNKGSPAAAACFVELQAAFEVLSNPHRRREYDLFERKRRFPTRAHFAADDTFSELFRPRHYEQQGNESSFRKKRRRRTVLQHFVSCTLEEIWHGVSKKLRVVRRVQEPGTEVIKKEEVYVPVGFPRGAMDGVTDLHTGVGDDLSGQPLQDIQFILQQKPHDRFTRRGTHLETVVPVSLMEALCGAEVLVAPLHGEDLHVNFERVFPDTCIRIAGEGMPICGPASAVAYGDMLIFFEIEYPMVVSEQQKLLLGAALGQASTNGQLHLLDKSRWMPDAERECCCGCESPFTVLNRRHHCRLCGLLFCRACATPRLFSTMGNRPQRMCTACFEQMRAR